MTKFKTAVLVVAGVLGLAMAVSPAASQPSITNNNTDNSTVTVNVAEKTAIDISPDTLDYNSVKPGSTQFGTNNDADNENFTHVELENIGSTNISRVWMNASTPSVQPFGTGVRSNYNAGNFIQVKPQDSGADAATTTYENWTFVTRSEFSTGNVPEYIFKPDEAGDWNVGRFRVADKEYFWAMNETSTDACATEAGAFRVGQVAHTLTDTGSNDFGDSSEYKPYTPSSVDADSPTAVVNNVNITGRNYRVKLDCSGGDSGGDVEAVRSRFNIELAESDVNDLTQPEADDAAEYLLNGSAGTEDALQPGERFSVQTRVSVPLGVAQGGVSNGYLRVLVNTY